jgi:hypothetical protein
VDDSMAKFSMCSPLTSINVVMLDHGRVVVEASHDAPPGFARLRV